MTTERQEPRKGRRLKITLACVIAFLVVAFLLLALAPTLVSHGLGQNAIRKAIGRRVAGTADFNTLRVGWSAPQRIEGLTIVDSDGMQAADINVTVNNGLLALITGSYNPLQIDLSGKLQGELLPDGKTSFQRLAPEQEKKKAPRKDRDKEPLKGVPHIVLHVHDLNVQLTDKATGKTMAVNDMTGDMAFQPGTDTQAKFTAKTVSDGTEGSVEIEAQINGLFDKSGALTPKGASANIQAKATNLPLPTAPPSQVQQLTFLATAKDLSSRLDVTVKADTVIDGQSPSSLNGAVSITPPFAKDGSPNLSLEAIEGTVTGTQVPTTLIEPFLTGTPLIASRDIGPAVDISAKFPPQTAGTPRNVSINVTGAHAQLTAAAQVDANDGSVRGDTFNLVADVAPALIAEASDLTTDKRADVRITLDSFFLPGTKDLSKLSATGSAVLGNQITVKGGHEQPFVLRLGKTTVNVTAAQLNKGVHVQATALLDGGTIELDQQLTNLLDGQGQLAVLGAKASGTISATDMPGSSVAQFLPENAIEDEILAGNLTANLTTNVSVDAQTASMAVKSDQLDVMIDVTAKEETIAVSKASGSITVTPALTAALQADGANPVTLAEPATVDFSMKSFTWPSEKPLHGQVGVKSAVLTNLTEGAEPIAVRNVDIEATVLLGKNPRVTATGTAGIRRQKSDKTIADLTYDVTLEPESNEPLRSASVAANSLSIVNLERALGRPKGTYSDWLGNEGELSAQAAEKSGSQHIALNAKLPNLTGAFVVNRSGDMVNVTADDAQMILKQAALQKFLAPSQVHSDVPVTFTLKEGQLPLGLLTGKSFKPSAVNVNANLTSGTLRFTTSDGVETSLQKLRASMTSNDLSKGINFLLNGTAAAGKSGQSGDIAVDGVAAGLMTADSKFSTENMVLEMTARGKSIPAVIPDALAQLDGMLVAAIGASIDGEVKANNFSSHSGTLSADFKSPNGKLDGRMTGADQAYHISKEDPLRAQLLVTHELGSRLLRNIHPILADVRTSKEPMRAVVGNVTLPADKDVSGLNADIDIEIGEVEFDSGSVMLRIMQLAKTDNAHQIQGYIEPIKARIRKGIVTYERFAVRIDQFTMVYTGTINLNTKQVDLHTEIPLEALGKSIHELSGYVDGLVVPLVTTGKLGDTKTQIDPNFNLAGQAAKAGIQSAIGELLKNNKNVPSNVGNVLDQLLKGSKKNSDKKD
jgi:hypothetical protein